MKAMVIRLLSYMAMTSSVVAFLVVPDSAYAGKRECTNSTVKGVYAIRMDGFITFASSPQFLLATYAPVAVVGTYIFDGTGHAARSILVNVAGQPITVTDSGSYQVSPDCSASARFSTNGESFALMPIEEQTMAIATTTAGESGSGTLTRQSITHCGANTLLGTYIFNANGLGTFGTPPQTADAFFPVAVMGEWLFDGNGTVSRTLALTFAGLPGPYDDSGTYQVHTDCTATVYFPSDNETFQVIMIDLNRADFGVASTGRSGTGVLLRRQR